jgi:hypothetical protein
MPLKKINMDHLKMALNLNKSIIASQMRSKYLMITKREAAI